MIDLIIKDIQSVVDYKWAGVEQSLALFSLLNKFNQVQSNKWNQCLHSGKGNQ